MPTVPLAAGPQARPTVAPLPDGRRVSAPQLVMGDFTMRQPAPLQSHDLSLPGENYIADDYVAKDFVGKEFTAKTFTATEPFHNAYHTTQPLHEDTAAQSEAALGRSLGAAGDEIADITTRVQMQANALVTDNAVNKAKEAALRLAYDKATGFTSLKGYDALNRPDGKPLADEYASKFDDVAKQLSGDLKNDAQRRAFASQAFGIRSSLYGQAVQHESNEFRTYNLSTQEGTIKIESDNIGLNYKDPTAVSTSVERIKGAVAEQGMALGKSVTWIEAAQQDAVSASYRKALEASMEDGNVVFADAFMRAHKGEMNPGDLLAVRGVITREMDGRMGLSAARDALATITPGFVSTDLDRMTAITAQAESGGRDRNTDGTPVLSPKGAQGKMQVMPKTNVDPGFGVKPAQNDSDAERARVGRDYLHAMVQRYNGDPAMAWAAYNWGPKNLDEAVKEAAKTGQSWFNLAPKETQDYVRDNMAALGAGVGKPPMPTLEQALAKLDNDPRVNSSPTRLDYARREVTARYAAMKEAHKQGEDEGFATALQAVEANGGNFLALPPSMRAAIPADKVDTVMNFADKVRAGNTVTNLAVYQKLTDEPTLKGMTDAQFYALRPELSPSDFQHFADARAKLLDPKNPISNGPGELNSPAIHMVVENRLQTLGIDPTPKGTDLAGMARVGAINKFVREQVLLAQAQHGKKFTDAETEAYIDGLFAKSVPFRNTVLGITVGHDAQRMLEMKPGDIPSDAADGIRNAFKKRGINNPSDADVLSAYWRTKSLAGR